MISSLRTLALLGLLVATGCSGPKPGPPPPAPAEAGLDPHYERAYAALRVHPAVQAFAAKHLDPSEPMAIEVSSELVPTDYALLAPAVLQADGPTASPDRLAAVRDSLAGLATADRFTPVTDDALPLLSMRQQRPLVLFFNRMSDGRLGAQLYPNPYRRRSYETVRDGAPGLVLLVLFDGGSVARVYVEEIEP
ncbi:MAG: hypothetical protein ABJF88_08895 [Rhodothermales bacterium]